MKNKVFSAFLALILLVCAVAPVQAHAEGNAGGWVELLEFSSVQSDGTNIFSMGASGSFSVPLYGEHRLRKVDILLWNFGGHSPTSASVTVDKTPFPLDVLLIGSNLTRIVGYIPNAWYTVLTVDLKKGSSTIAAYEVLSCKVTGVGVQEFTASASVYFEDYGHSGYYDVPEHIPFYVENSGGYYSDASDWLARVEVYDWEKYDSLSVWGSVTSASIESIRASLETTALDYTINYIDAESPESFIDGDPAYSVTNEWGKYLFNITIDLSGVDRTLGSSPLLIYFTGSRDTTVSGGFNCQYVNGSIATADTTEIKWWNRFTSFMQSLVGGDTANSEEFEGEAADKRDELDGLNQEMESVTKPDIEDIDTSLESFVSDDDLALVGESFSQITGDSLITTMLVMGLSVALLAYILYGKR